MVPKHGSVENYREGFTPFYYHCGQCGTAIPGTGVCSVCGSETYRVSGHYINPWLKVFMQLIALGIVWLVIQFWPF